MGELNKVSVRIHGQEYILSGDLPREQIIRIAALVDGKMAEIAKLAPTAALSSLAVLTAVNVAEEYFKLETAANEHTNQLKQQERDSQHYEQLWEEAKKSFIQYKEDAQAALEQVDSLKNQLITRQTEIAQIKLKIQEAEEKAVALQKKNDSLSQRLVAQEGDRESSVTKAKELENKCRELESSFFDLQMENIQLKGEIDRYKKIVE